jgi:hypothetical protein
VSLLGPAGRWVDRQTRRVSRAIKSVPVVGAVVKAGSGALTGPVGRTFNRIISNPVVSTVFGPITVPAHMAYAGVTGGVAGAEAAAKQEIRNPVRRVAVTALGAVFPPAAPAAVALNAANVALDAAESGKPEDMAKAAAQIGAAYAGADAGDPHLQQVAAVLDQAKRARAAIPGHLPNLHELNAEWLGSTRANSTLEQIHPDAHASLQPGLVQQSIGTLLHAVSTKAGQQVAPNVFQHAQSVVANALAMGHMHPHIPFFVDLSAAAHRALAPVLNSSHPNAGSIVRNLEAQFMAHTSHRIAELNQLVLGYNARHPDALQKVDALKVAHSRGDHAATAMLDDVRRRTAALRKAHEYTVDHKGYARHAGPGHPAAQPAPAKPPIHAPGHAPHPLHH